MGVSTSRFRVVSVGLCLAFASACASDEANEDPIVEVGYFQAEEFLAIEAGDPCWVSEGEASDLMADLTVRTVGMAGEAGTITCALFDDELGAIAFWHSQRLFADTGDGARQVTVRLRLDGATGVEQIDGRDATLQCEVMDADGVIGDRLVDVVLTAR